MTAPARAAVSLGVQAGDKDADKAVSPHYLALRRLLAEKCTATYSEVIREFAPVLRIDGSIWHWDKQGCGNVRVQKKSGYATVDIFMPVEIWSGGDGKCIRRYLVTHLTSGIESMLEKASGAGISVDRSKLIADVAAATSEFLGEKKKGTGSG